MRMTAASVDAGSHVLAGGVPDCPPTSVMGGRAVGNAINPLAMGRRADWTLLPACQENKPYAHHTS
jgi:hypothetical protein